MLNRVILMGRITQELELKQTPSGVQTLSFNVAVERNYTGADGQRQTDFITCVAWRQQAEFISRYFGKGRMIALEGSLRTRTYDDKNGSKHYVTEVYADSVSFTGEPKSTAQAGGQRPQEKDVSTGSESVPGITRNGYKMSFGKAQEENEPFDLSEFDEIISDDGVPF